ncbi:MAG TPA: 2-dehydropantoate 2-reductase [Solirubrobacteraceae bacterium]|jgi:2-dehydropantoate 2-reductase|nr:2-dehydropantoate 2-reductase [Solirubrobacteraceae bacterium]
MRIAVLGPGGVGGLLAGALQRAGEDVTVVARESTAAAIEEQGLRVSSVKLGDFVAHPRVLTRLEEPLDALIVATKAAGLEPALERVAAEPPIVLPLLNGLDHLALLRERFAPETVVAGTVRVEADRPAPGVNMHTSPFLLVEMASRYEPARDRMDALVTALTGAGVSARADRPIGQVSEAQVMWSKLVRLNALACTTSAYDKLLGEIRSTPALRADLIGAIEESCAAGQAEGADNVNPQKAIEELEKAHATLGSSMQRDIAAGRAPEVDAIPGAVLRAAGRHGSKCPTIERLVAMILARVEGVEG